MEFGKRVKHQWQSLDEAWRFAITAFLVARIFYAIWSWVILTIQPIAVHYIDVDDEPAAVFLDLHTIQSYTYYREANGETLTFRSANRNTVSDLQTGSIWDVHSGVAIEGHFKGHALESASRPDMFPYFHATPYPQAWLGLWQRFDANWYISIAKQGYGAVDGDYAFPPFYPLLIRVLTPIFRDAFLAGLFISHISAIYALKLFYDLIMQWKDHQSAKQTATFLLLFPSSFFLFSAYTESLFLVLAMLSMNFIMRRSWHWAGFFIFLASLTRIQGVALLFPLAFAMWKEYPFLRSTRHWLGGAIGGTGFLFYTYLRSNYIQANSNSLSDPVWHARLVSPWRSYAIALNNLFSNDFNHIDFINLATATLFSILLILCWRNIPVEYNLYSLFSMVIILTRVVEGQPLLATTRYALTLFPIFYFINITTSHPALRRVYIYICLALNLFLSAEFFGWGYVA